MEFLEQGQIGQGLIRIQACNVIDALVRWQLEAVEVFGDLGVGVGRA